VLWFFSLNKSNIDSGYLAIYTYIKYLVVAIFIFAVIVEVDLFRLISVEGNILGLGEVVGGINFSGKTAAFANFALVFSVGNIAAYILALNFGGVVIQTAEFAKQSEIYKISLFNIFNGELGNYSIILFVSVILIILFIIFLSVWKLEKTNFIKNALILIVGVVVANILIVSISTFSFQFTRIIQLGINISIIPIVLITISELLLVIGIKFISFKLYKKDEKGVAS
jgi:hypothetical protein